MPLLRWFHLYSQNTIAPGADTVALPAVFQSIVLLVYCYRKIVWFTAHPGERKKTDDLTTLGIGCSLVQMAPLLILKRNLLRCPDRVPIISRFACKALIMHILLFAYRVGLFFSGLDDTGSDPVDVWINVFFCIANFAVLVLVFEVQFKELWFDNSDVAILHFLAFLCSVYLDFHDKQKGAKTNEAHMKFVATEFCNQIEIVAFFNAAWVIYRMGDQLRFSPIPEANAQMRAKCFFAFLFFYYMYEDIIIPQQMPLEREGRFAFACTRVLHFLVLQDFAVFFLSQAHTWKVSKPDPEMVKKESVEMLGKADHDNGVSL